MNLYPLVVATLAKVKKNFNAHSSCGGSRICEDHAGNTLTWESLEFENLHKHKHSRHKLEFPSIENVVDD